jgi:hypothetical protein
MLQKHEDRVISDMTSPPLEGEQLVIAVSKAANEICKRLNCLANLETPQASATGEALPHADKLISERVCHYPRFCLYDEANLILL